MSSGESNTRTRILKETWRLMEKHPGQYVRIRDIAQAAGVSRQAVYINFHSRSELLIATARYVDEERGLNERLQRFLTADNSVKMLDAYVEFWANYIPEIYGLAKALLAMYEMDEAAKAAWDDRMAALRDGCQQVIQCLEREQSLAPIWNISEATDLMWTMLSISHWDDLTRARGWSIDQYVRWMQVALKQIFVIDES